MVKVSLTNRDCGTAQRCRSVQFAAAPLMMVGFPRMDQSDFPCTLELSMNFRSVVLTFILIATTVAFSIPVQAQDLSPQRLEKILKRFPQADLNGDGTLTKEEALEAMQRFQGQQKRQQKPDIAPKPTFENVKYGPYDRNVFDIWVPESDQPTALIVHIHGGGFVGGDKTGIRKTENVQKALDQGCAVASINYRFRYLPESGIDDPQRAGIQDILRDAARSIQFMRQNATEYNLDPNRIGCFGGSAGAGTSIWLAFHDDLADPNHSDPVLRQSSRISVAGMLAGQYTYDMEQWDADFADRGGDLVATHGGTEKDIALFYGMTWEDYQDSDVRTDVNMRGLITADDPPVFALTGGPDEKIADVGIYYHHPRHPMLIEERCKQEGVECVCLVPKVRDSDAATLKQNPDLMLSFFFKHLGVLKNEQLNP